MNAVWNSYGQLCGCPEIFKKSCKFFCRELDIRVPKGMKPRHVHVMDVIGEMEDAKGFCRVGDVSAKMGITMPSITKLIQELELLGMVEKYHKEEDKRAAYLHLTTNGWQCVRQYVTELHGKWAAALEDVTDQQVQDAVFTIQRLYETISRESGGGYGREE